MSFAINIIGYDLRLLFLYGIGVFALYLQTGISLLSAVLEASGCFAAFSISHFQLFGDHATLNQSCTKQYIQ